MKCCVQVWGDYAVYFVIYNYITLTHAKLMILSTNIIDLIWTLYSLILRLIFLLVELNLMVANNNY